MIRERDMYQQAGVRDHTGRLLALWTLLCVLAGVLLGALLMQVEIERYDFTPEKVKVYQNEWGWQTYEALRIERDVYRMQLDSVMASYWSVPWRCQ